MYIIFEAPHFLVMSFGISPAQMYSSKYLELILFLHLLYIIIYTHKYVCESTQALTTHYFRAYYVSFQTEEPNSFTSLANTVLDMHIRFCGVREYES